MTRTRGQFGADGERGYALIFSLGVMVVLLTVGLRFLAVIHSRQKTTDNEKKAIQACLLADSAVERAVRDLSENASWNGGYSALPLADGTYSVAVTNRGAGYVMVRAEGAFGGTTRARTACVYTPGGSGQTTIWAHSYGTGLLEWKDKERLIDRTDGENGMYANHKLGEDADQMSLGGFGSDIRSATITKVEIVLSGYTGQSVVDDRLLVQWYLSASAAAGQWLIWPESDLDSHVYSPNTGRMVLDVTDYPPPGGWQWRHFYHGTDLELRFASLKVLLDDGVYLYVDCAGFRVTWQAQ
ncbi:MAG: hypothetical protein JW889_09875 [Verrucomicrobia bacterium]|nr:hypothetical protein [Verrucomicrobiota bacterium]